MMKEFEEEVLVLLRRIAEALEARNEIIAKMSEDVDKELNRYLESLEQI